MNVTDLLLDVLEFGTSCLPSSRIHKDERPWKWMHASLECLEVMFRDDPNSISWFGHRMSQLVPALNKVLG